jgi:hypothetical protein
MFKLKRYQQINESIEDNFKNFNFNSEDIENIMTPLEEIGFNWELLTDSTYWVDMKPQEKPDFRYYNQERPAYRISTPCLAISLKGKEFIKDVDIKKYFIRIISQLKRLSPEFKVIIYDRWGSERELDPNNFLFSYPDGILYQESNHEKNSPYAQKISHSGLILVIVGEEQSFTDKQLLEIQNIVNKKIEPLNVVPPVYSYRMNSDESIESIVLFQDDLVSAFIPRGSRVFKYFDDFHSVIDNYSLYDTSREPSLYYEFNYDNQNKLIQIFKNDDKIQYLFDELDLDSDANESDIFNNRSDDTVLSFLEDNYRYLYSEIVDYYRNEYEYNLFTDIREDLYQQLEEHFCSELDTEIIEKIEISTDEGKKYYYRLKWNPIWLCDLTIHHDADNQIDIDDMFSSICHDSETDSIRINDYISGDVDLKSFNKHASEVLDYQIKISKK